jgi:hypothetical protein
MLASLPVSMLNQSLDDLGIPIRINLTSFRSSQPGWHDEVNQRHHTAQMIRLYNNKIVRMQVGDLNIRQSYAVVIAEVNYRIMTTIRRQEQGLRLARLRFI